MSWAQWPPPVLGAGMPGMPMGAPVMPMAAAPIAAPAPVAAAQVAYPGAAASLDQWTQMQQQNWQQWAQWQQQYQQWHQQYGEEYQKMAALQQQQQQLTAPTALPTAQHPPLPGVPSQPPPPPSTEPKPPLPPDEPPAHSMPAKGYQTYNSAPPPLPPIATKAAVTAAPGYSTMPTYNMGAASALPPLPKDDKPVVGPGYGYGYGGMQTGGYNTLTQPPHMQQQPPPSGGWNQQQQQQPPSQPHNKPPTQNQPPWANNDQSQQQQQQQQQQQNKGWGGNDSQQSQSQKGSWDNQQGRNSWGGNQQIQQNSSNNNKGGRWSSGGGDGSGSIGVAGQRGEAGYNQQQNQRLPTSFAGNNNNNNQPPPSLLSLNIQKPSFDNRPPDFVPNKPADVDFGTNRSNFGADKPDFAGNNKRPYQNQATSPFDAKRNKMDVPPHQASPQQQNWQTAGENRNKAETTITAERNKDDNNDSHIDPGKQQEIIDDMTEAERKFMKQFAEWEAQFNKWKEQNQDHPDKDQYKQYEKKWETWRNQLLERREQMRKKRLAAQMKIQIHHIQSAPTAPTAAAPMQANMPQQPSSVSTPQPSPSKSVVSAQQTMKLPQATPPLPSSQTNLQPDFHRPPPFMNNEPLQFKGKPLAEAIPGETRVVSNVGDDKYSSYEASLMDVGVTDPENEFLKSSDAPQSLGGIPGLDLGEDANKGGAYVSKTSDESGKSMPDLEALSKNINNILGDAKLLSMLSMVSQNKNIEATQPETPPVENITQPAAQPAADPETVQQYAYNQQVLQKQMQWQPYKYEEKQQQQQNFNAPPMNFDAPPPNFPGQGFSMDNSRGNANFNENRQNFNFNDYNRGNFNSRGNSTENRGNFDFSDSNRPNLNLNNDQRTPNFNCNDNRGNFNSSFPPPQNNDWNNQKQDNFNSRNPYGDSNKRDSEDIPDDNFLNKDKKQQQVEQEVVPEQPELEAELSEAELWSGKLIDYDHKPLKEPEPEVMIEPLQTFDYRHRPVNRIPYPERPKWLADILKNFKEFDTPLARPPFFPGSDRPPNNNSFNNRPPFQNFENRGPNFENRENRGPNFNERDTNFEGGPPNFDRGPNLANRGSSYDNRDNRGPNFTERDNRGANFVGRDNRGSSFNDRDNRGANFADRSNRGSSFAERDTRGSNFGERDNRGSNFGERDNRGSNYGERDNRGSNFGDRDRGSRFDNRSRNNARQSDHLNIASEMQESFQSINSPDSFDNQDDLVDDADKFKSSAQNKLNSEFNLAHSGGFNKIPESSKDAPIFDMLSNPPPLKPKDSNVTYIKELLDVPGRFHRPPRIVIILRGPPGSGKTHLAKLIKDTEVEHGGSAPRILSLDDYFIVEQEKDVQEDGKTVKRKEMVYEYEEGMEDSYRQSLLKSFKKTVTDGYFPFIVVDNVNEKVKYFGDMWSFAKQNGFQVYVCTLDLDAIQCTRRNIHKRTAAQIERIVFAWEKTPAHHTVLDASAYMKSDDNIADVEMEDVSATEGTDPATDEDGTQLLLDDMEGAYRSKWDTFDCSINNLAKLDGTSKPLRHNSMQSYLQLDAAEDDDFVQPEYVPGGKKRVRWADVEERKQQAKMREVGFVVGQTDWGRMMDPSRGAHALTHTKFIERTSKYKLHK